MRYNITSADADSFVFNKECTLFDRRERYVGALDLTAYVYWDSARSSLPSYQPLLLIIYSCGLLSSLPHHSHFHCRHLTEGLYFIQARSFSGTTCVGGRSIVRTLVLYRCATTNSCMGHINNIYNTTFWALVDQGGLSPTQAEEHLKVIAHVI